MRGVGFSLGMRFVVLAILLGGASTFSAELPGDTLQAEVDQIRSEGAGNEALKPFLQMPEPLFRWMVLEKRHLHMERSSRSVVDALGNSISGVLENSFPSEAEFQEHPQSFSPIRLRGVWVPEKEGDLFSLSGGGGEQAPSPFRRKGAAEAEILFLVHPRSEKLFAPLLEKYRDQTVEIPALVMSSFRTLLVALPGQDGKPTFAMVKLSLDEVIRGTSRVLTKKESAASLVSSHILQSLLPELPGFNILEEVLSFVPFPNWVQGGRQAGMIVRKIPDYLLTPSSSLLLVPFYSLLGEKNSPLFIQTIEASGLAPVEFITEKILKPYARVFVDLVFRFGISPEMHAQNLLLLVDSKTFQPIEGHEFVYRDMGGVAIDFDRMGAVDLPNELLKREFFYADHFEEDSGNSLEDHFAGGLLIFLNQQLLHMESTTSRSEQEEATRSESGFLSFHDWQSQMIQFGKLINWIHPHLNSSQLEVPIGDFVQYGYFEQIFGKILMETLQNRGAYRFVPKGERFRIQLINQEFVGRLQDPSPSHAFKDFWIAVLSLRPR